MEEKKYLPWHVHTIHSTRDGLIKVPELVKKCVDSDMGVMVSDHGSHASFIEVYNECKIKKVKPVFGVELYINRNRERMFELKKLLKEEKNESKKKVLSYEFEDIKKYNHIVVAAKNLHGFHNLISLTNKGFTDGFYHKPIITRDELINLPKDKSGTRGLIVSTACLASEASQYIIKEQYDNCLSYLQLMHEEFNDDFYIEVQAVNMDIQKRVNEKLLEYSKKLKIPAIIATDAHYLEDKYKDAHQLLLLLQGKQSISDVGKKVWRITFENAKGEIRRKKYEKGSEFRKDVDADKIQVGDVVGKSKSDKVTVIKKEELDKVWIIEADDLSLKSENEIRKTVKLQHPELAEEIDNLIETNKSIYEKVEHFDIDSRLKLPKIKDAESIIRAKVEAALKDFGFSENQVYVDRANRELDTIIQNGFETYFLILEDIVTFAKQQDIPVGYGRGSVGGCLVAYLLKMQEVDPIVWNLQFERFLSKDRGGKMGYPDIDFDSGNNPLNGNGRKTIVNYLIKKYGDEHVCYVGNRLMYSGKSIIRDLGQVYDIPSSDTFACTKLYDDNFSVKENMRTHKKIKEFFEKYPQLQDKVPQFDGLNSALGVHAGGVIITDKKYPISKYFALQRPKEKDDPDGDRIATMWTKDEVAQVGGVKYDLLGLDCASQIHIGKQLLSKDPYKRFEVIDDIIKDEMLRVKNRNVFQFTSNIGKKAIVDFKPTTLNELANASAVIRILDSQGGRDAYANYKTNIEEFQCGNTEQWRKFLKEEVYDKKNYKICEEILTPTFGILIYQEQLIQIISAISDGVKTYTDGNIIRKALEKFGKKYGPVERYQGQKDLLKTWHTEFMSIIKKDVIPYLGKDGLESEDQDVIDFINFKVDHHNNLPVPKKGLLRMIMTTGVYLFNRSHAIAYTLNSYEQIYMKHKHPMAFWVSSLICGDKLSKTADFIIGARVESGIQTLPPSINKSNFFFKQEGKNIRYSLGNIMMVANSGRDIVAERKSGGEFASIKDFCTRLPGINKRVIESLIRTNAFSDFGTIEEVEQEILKFYPDIECIGSSDKSQIEATLLGLNISFLDPLVEEARECASIDEIEDGVPSYVAISIEKTEEKKTKKGKPYLMHICIDANSSSKFNLFNWDKLKIQANRINIVAIKKNNGFVSLVGI